MDFKVITDYPVATESYDHLYPTGATNDNSTDLGFINEVEEYFYFERGEIEPLNILDLGCAGGQLIVDFANRGHDAIGLEGSSKPAELGLFNWPEYHNKNLFTCDIGKPFKIFKEFEYLKGGYGVACRVVKFDLITAWEVLEHLKIYELAVLFENIKNSLKMVMLCTDYGVQVMGGHGYIRDNPVELWFRNGRGFVTFTGMAIV